jgi:hypothetical protein
MPLVIVTVREESFPETHCWALDECMTQAVQAAGWSAEPWAQKIVRLPPAEFTYHPSVRPDGSAAEIPSFILVEVLLLHSRPATRRRCSGSSFAQELKRGSDPRNQTSF